jgi:Fe-S-cluster containining protein
MFEKYYRKLRFSQKIGDKSLVECMKVIESNRNYVLSSMKDKNIFCHQGCNLCCHSLSLMNDPLNSYILLRVFQSIPYHELFPYYKKCAENRMEAQKYIDLLPDDVNNNYFIDTYNQLGFTTQSCPFVDRQNGCIIYEFRPQTCFTYFSSIPCKMSSNPKMSEAQMKNSEAFQNTFKNTAESIIKSGLDNDYRNYLFDDNVLKTYEKFNNIEKAMKQDINLQCFLSHSIRYEILTILSLALEMQNQEKYKNDTIDLNVYLLADIDGEKKYL